MSLHKNLLKLFPDYSVDDWVLQDDGEGNPPFIASWNRVEPQPSASEISAVKAQPDIVALHQQRDMAVEKLLEIEGRKGAGDAAVKDYITKRDQKRTPK